MADSGSPKANDRTRKGGPTTEQIDTGILVAFTGSTVTYVTIYRPPLSNPPSGFNSNYVYYYIQNALPTTSTTLTTTVSNPTGSPGFSATQAVKAPHATFTNQNRTPAASSSMWVDSSGNWSFVWGVSGTGSSASGSVVWWNNSSSNLAPSSGSVSNNTSLNSGVTYSAVDNVS